MESHFSWTTKTLNHPYIFLGRLLFYPFFLIPFIYLSFSLELRKIDFPSHPILVWQEALGLPRNEPQCWAGGSCSQRAQAASCCPSVSPSAIPTLIGPCTHRPGHFRTLLSWLPAVVEDVPHMWLSRAESPQERARRGRFWSPKEGFGSGWGTRCPW